MSLSKAVITSDVIAVSLLLPPCIFTPRLLVQLSLREPTRTRSRRQVLTDDEEATQQHIVKPQALLTPKQAIMLVSKVTKPQPVM